MQLSPRPQLHLQTYFEFQPVRQRTLLRQITLAFDAKAAWPPSEQDNIRDDELAAFKMLRRNWLAYDDEALANAIAAGIFIYGSALF
jgi:hypothetical protein